MSREPSDASAAGKAEAPAPGLYVTATPIGNLGDITLRALETLRNADLIACEDTRITARLLARYAIATPRIAYHEHNAERVLPTIVARLRAGQSVVLVSDAGTPLISDPGYRLVRAALDAGMPVVPLPGPSAVTAALAAAGLPTDRFHFAGFPPPRRAARRRAIGELAGLAATLVWFESPRRLAALLADLAAVLGPREACVARELTKLHEEMRRGLLPELAAHYAAAPARGEVTVLVAPPGKTPPETDADTLDALLVEALARRSPSGAAAEVAARTGADRRTLYDRAVALKRSPETSAGPARDSSRTARSG